MYAYSYNNPIKYYDPDGRCGFSNLCEDPEEFNYFSTIEFTNILRDCVGAEYSHLRMPTSSKMDCSGMLVYALNKMGFDVPSDITAAKIANGEYNWIEVFDEVDDSRQGEDI